MAAPKKEVKVLGQDDQGRNKCEGDYDIAQPGHPTERLTGTYEYLQCSNDEQAITTVRENKWRLYELVNNECKNRARANETQKVSATFRSTTTPDKIRARMVSDALRLGMSREDAEAMVAGAFGG